MSQTFNARTIKMTVNWYGVENGQRSRKKSLEMWENFLAVFALGHTGELTFTDGDKRRVIECYAAEVPMLTETVFGLFSAEFTLTADYPIWFEPAWHSKRIQMSLGSSSHEYFEIENYSSIYVPFRMVFTSQCGIQLTLLSDGSDTTTSEKHVLAFNKSSYSSSSDRTYIDTRLRQAYTAANDMSERTDVTMQLSPTSEFYMLAPGTNHFKLENYNSYSTNEIDLEVEYREGFLGV